ncbi:response regulator transcription factor [Umezawaea sp.]|uniref:response regulator transcription factor n=1 Tax=Umezawaea sp. TaxID=1955258 RepID=UPI002ED20677
MERVRVVVQTADHLSMAGLTSYLGGRAEIEVLDWDQRATANVVVVAVDRISPEVLTGLRRVATDIGAPVVLVLDEVGERDVLAAVEHRVVAILPRTAATGAGVLRSVLAAASGGGVMPPSLVAELLKHVERLQRALVSPDTSVPKLTPREADVLRLMADGLGTAEIADRLCYAERTIKNVFYGLTTRLNLRNRPHAVAYALRKGMI